ncbi:MAG: hypothetical protein WA304_12670 [Candidatus Cybelea sp.]
MQWMMDLIARKPKPSNTEPGLIYMLNGVMRDAGTMVMFAGTPYAHLRVCGSPCDGNEYRPGDRGVWTMTYARP